MDPQFTSAVTRAQTRLDHLDFDAPIPQDLHMAALPLTIARWAGISPNVQPPAGNAIIHRGFAQSTPNKDRPPSQRRPPPEDVQYSACRTYGHKVDTCFTLCRVLNCIQYATRKETKAKELVTQFNKQNSEKVKKVERVIANLLMQTSAIDNTHNSQSVANLLATQLQLAYDTSDDAPDYDSDTDARTAHAAQIHRAYAISDATQDTICLLPGFYDPTPPLPLQHATPLKPDLTPARICQVQSFSPPTMRTQGDTGANRSITNDIGVLFHYHPISNFTVSGVDTNSTMVCEGQGIMKLRGQNGGILEVPTLYCSQSSGTIFSPDNFVETNQHNLCSWTQTGNIKTNRGHITFHDHSGHDVVLLEMTREKGLWFTTPIVVHPPDICPPVTYHRTPVAAQPCHSMSHPQLNTCSHSTPDAPSPPTLSKQQLLSEIWHQRFAHPSALRLQRTQQHVEGMPTLLPPHPLFVCEPCGMAKMTKARKGTPAASLKEPRTIGERFHMDFGFVRGPPGLPQKSTTSSRPTGVSIEHSTESGSHTTIIPSRQGYTSYLLIIDAATRYIWIFMSKTKEPPLITLQAFLTQYGIKDNTQRYIRTDGGGELAASQAFRQLVMSHGYILEPTGPDASSQNGMAERPHRTLANMIRCMLYSTGLGTPFWSDAMIYATYLYNRLYHSSILKTPFEALTKLKPDVAHLRTFGSSVIVRKPGRRPTKLDPHVYHGIFLRFAGTTKNVVYYDVQTQREKVARHVHLDEFHYGKPDSHRPPAARAILKQSTGDTPSHQLGGDALLHTSLIDTPHPPDQTILIDTTVTPMDTTADFHPITTTAQAAMATVQSPQHHNNDLAGLHLSLDIFGPSVTETLLMNTPHPTLGLQFTSQDLDSRPRLTHCISGTPAAKIKHWRSRLRHATLRAYNGIQIYTLDDLLQAIKNHCLTHAHTCSITFAKDCLSATPHTSEFTPQLHFDQLHVIAHHLHTLWCGDDHWKDTTSFPPISEATLIHAAQTGLATTRLTRRILKQRPDWPDWQASEYSQLQKYETQHMFGPPCQPPSDNTIAILPFVWTYIYKDMKPKARATCNGSARYGKAVTLAHTYAACVEQPGARLYWALVALNGMIAIGADAGNAFAEAPAPKQPFFMRVDDPYRDWWVNDMQRPPIPVGWVLPVNHALQGHPESPRLWERHINDILHDLGFVGTTHERCLYRSTIRNQAVLFLRQVDDFSVACTDRTIAEDVIRNIGQRLTVPLHDLGIIAKFNGVDITQTRTYIRLSCESYLHKIISQHGWQDDKTANVPTPMRSDSTYQSILELAERPIDSNARQALQMSEGFSYRQAIGELIFAMTIARPDIAYATIKLSQYSDNPAKTHYQAVRHIFAYLNATKTVGLQYWQQFPHPDLPMTPHIPPVSLSHAISAIPNPPTPHYIYGFTDSDWGSDRTHRRSVTGIAILLAGAAIAYKTKYQPTVALSSTEAEFMAAADAGKTTLYIRSILNELGYTQLLPTILYEDNSGALLMTNAQQPTRRTRHVDIRHFAVLQWVEDDEMIFHDIRTALNIADSLTKPTGRIKFHEHMDVLLGKRPPHYVTHHELLTHTPSTSIPHNASDPSTLDKPPT